MTNKGSCLCCANSVCDCLIVYLLLSTYRRALKRQFYLCAHNSGSVLPKYGLLDAEALSVYAFDVVVHIPVFPILDVQLFGVIWVSLFLLE